MSKKAIATEAGPRPEGGYSQAVVAGSLVFTAGQAALDPASGELRGETVAEQTQHTLDNIEALLGAVGASLADVVKTTVHLTEMAGFEEFDAAYSRRMPAPPPARTTVASGLGPGILVEIDAVAVLPDHSQGGER